MSAYDMQIGKLISGQRDLEGDGMYMLCAPDKTIAEVDSLRRTRPKRGAVIEQGESGKGSPYSFWKTDYEAYEHLIELGETAVPYIGEHLNDKLKEDTRLILETAVRDLGQL